MWAESLHDFISFSARQGLTYARFAYMWQYLGLPFQDIAIIEKEKAKL